MFVQSSEPWEVLLVRDAVMTLVGIVLMTTVVVEMMESGGRRMIVIRHHMTAKSKIGPSEIMGGAQGDRVSPQQIIRARNGNEDGSNSPHYRSSNSRRDLAIWSIHHTIVRLTAGETLPIWYTAQTQILTVMTRVIAIKKVNM